MGLNLATVLAGLAVSYLIYTTYSLYILYNPKQCPNRMSPQCLQPNYGTELEFHIYTSTDRQGVRDKKFLLDMDNVVTSVSQERTVNVTVPVRARRNGTMFIHIDIKQPTSDSGDGKYMDKYTYPLTMYYIPQPKAYHFNSQQSSQVQDQESKIPITHWKPVFVINLMTDYLSIDRHAVIPELYPLLRIGKKPATYSPVLYMSDLYWKTADLIPVFNDTEQMELVVKYEPISVGKLRLLLHLEKSFDSMKSLGFSDKDLDDMKSLFTDTSFYLLLLTVFISVIHLVFDFLAFKNDISYWRKKKSMVGMSTRAVVWRSVSSTIIFFYLLDEKTSLLVLIPFAIGNVIELWKLLKAFRIKLSWNKFYPTLSFGSVDKGELQTEAYDSEAMKYLSYALYPLVICGAVYSFIYLPHRSWYSWCLNSMVNGVYAFGFLFMLPQLFVNYKMKSVAHLPWKVFMYKAFNTFIDDVFAFIITMPTAHRLACFRDDFVFIIFLYQRWLYPVDKKRVNEFGMSFDTDESKKDK